MFSGHTTGLSHGTQPEGTSKSPTVSHSSKLLITTF